MQSKRGICREEQVNEGRKRGGSSAGDLSPFQNQILAFAKTMGTDLPLKLPPWKPINR